MNILQSLRNVALAATVAAPSLPPIARATSAAAIAASAILPSTAEAAEDHCHPFPRKFEMIIDNDGNVLTHNGAETMSGITNIQLRIQENVEGQTDALFASWLHEGTHHEEQIGSFLRELGDKDANGNTIIKGNDIVPCASKEFLAKLNKSTPEK